MTLDAGEFIRRFLLHVLPRGFRRIRHFGFLANAGRTAKLAQIRTALEAPEPPSPVQPSDYRERYALLTGYRIGAGGNLRAGLPPLLVWLPARPLGSPGARRSAGGLHGLRCAVVYRCRHQELFRHDRPWSHINQVACALRFFYGVTLGQKEAVARIRAPAARLSQAPLNHNRGRALPP